MRTFISDIIQRLARRLCALVRGVLRVFGRAMVVLLLLIASMRWVNPPTSSIIVQANWSAGERRGAVARVNFHWQPLERIATPMALAVIAAEDQRFPRHYGVDFIEIYRTMRYEAGPWRGASTITQQVAKNLFLWQGRSYTRKMIEAVLAFYTDFVWGKARVLEIYMNIAQFAPNIYGVENAAQYFFAKSAAQLNDFEAAFLAAVLPNPSVRSVEEADAQLWERQHRILQGMRALGTEVLDAL